MQFRCVCGQVLSAEAAPGTVVQCPACGQMIQVPGGPPAPDQPPYAPAYEQYAPPRTSGLALAAMVLGLLSIIFLALTGIPAAILGGVAIAKVRKSRGTVGGGGMAIAGLVLGIVFTLVTALPIMLVPIMLPSLARASESARVVQCADQLRNINLAVFQYVVGSDDELPPADHNICLALGVHMGDATDRDAGGDAWRCPSDHFIPEKRRKYWCSYAPNASVEETDEVIGCFSSNASLSNRISHIAPDTIMFVEMWTPPEVVPGHPGYELRLDHGNPENWRRSMVEPGRELCAIRSYRTARPVKFDAAGRLTDAGNYLFLRAFVGKRPSEMYHNGRINVSFIDGHVQTMLIEDLIREDRPINDPRWTRDAD